MSTNAHPFYPLEPILDDYRANDWSVPALLGGFVTTCTVILCSTLTVSRTGTPTLPGRERALVLWFVWTGCIHLFLEGYFAYNHRRMPRMHDFLGQLWKEYAQSDSRYMTRDSFVVCMEFFTAVLWGPLSFLTAALITAASPYRHPVQALVSTGQLYGNVLYYSTSLYDHFGQGVSYSRPDAYYYWGYFVFLNTFWVVVPGLCVYSSMKVSARAIGRTKMMPGFEPSGKTNGSAKTGPGTVENDVLNIATSPSLPRVLLEINACFIGESSSATVALNKRKVSLAEPNNFDG